MANVRMPGRTHTVHKTRRQLGVERTFCGLTNPATVKTTKPVTCGRCIKAAKAEETRKASKAASKRRK